MSIKLMTWIWEAGPNSQPELLVMLALADMSNDDGICWPAMGTIAARARMSDRNARRVIRHLEETGWLSVEVSRGRNQTNRYHLSKPDKAMSNRTECQPRQVKPENRSETKLKAVAVMSAEPSGNLKEPSEEDRTAGSPSKKKVKPRLNEGEVLTILGEVLSAEVAQAYIDHRKSKRSAMTVAAARLIVKSLAGNPHANSIVNASIMNGWTGVFPDRHGSINRGTGPNLKQIFASIAEKEQHQ